MLNCCLMQKMTGDFCTLRKSKVKQTQLKIFDSCRFFWGGLICCVFSRLFSWKIFEPDFESETFFLGLKSFSRELDWVSPSEGASVKLMPEQCTSWEPDLTHRQFGKVNLSTVY